MRPPTLKRTRQAPLLRVHALLFLTGCSAAGPGPSASGGLPGAGGDHVGGSPSDSGGSSSSGGTFATGGWNQGSSGGYGGANGGSAGGGSPSSSGGAGGGGTPAAGGRAAGGSASGGSTARIWPAYSPAADQEDTGKDCELGPLAAPDALPSTSGLPNPFVKMDGTTMSRRSEWRCRRQEILRQAQTYIYGEKPAFDLVSGSVSWSKIDVHVEAEGNAIDFSADVVLPNSGTGPFPAIINIGGKGGFGGITLGESRLLEQGVAVIYYNHGELGREGTAEASRGLPNSGLFYDLYGGDHSAGLLMAWAWGASRLIDVIQNSEGNILDISGLGVTGCSRNGKGAFTVGVFDERIALTIPHETSTGGVPAYRIVDFLNTERTDHNYFGLNWLSNDFEPFVYQNGTSRAVKLPLDTHALVAMVAPRGLLVLENPHQAQYSAPAGHVATVGGALVYEALGVKDNVSYHSDVSATEHCSYKPEYTQILSENIAKFLKHESHEPGRFEVSQAGTGNVSEWIDWVAPTLEADVSFVVIK